MEIRGQMLIEPCVESELCEGNNVKCLCTGAGMITDDLL